MDAGFDKDEAELGVFVFSVALEMFAHGDSLERTVDQYRVFDWKGIVFNVCGITFLINM